MNPKTDGSAWQRAVALVLAATLMFAFLDATNKYLVRAYPVPMIAWARYFFHLVTFGVLVVVTHRSVALRTKRLPLHVVRGLLLVVVSLLFITALGRISLADATAIGFTTPLLVIPLSVLVLGEKVGWHRWAAVVLGFGGVLTIVRPGTGAVDAGALYALGMALCYALYQIATRSLGRTEHSVTSMFYLALVGTIAMSLAAPFFWTWPTRDDLLLMILTGLLGGGGHFLLIQALRYAEASLLAPLFYVQLIYAALVGYAVFGEVPDSWTISGSVLIAVAGLWAWSRERAARSGSN